MRWTAFLILLLLSTTPLRGAQAQSAEERLAEASALFDAKRYEQAATKLDQFLTLFAQHEKAPNVALALGRCYTELKQYGKAVPAYERAATIKDPMLRSAALLGLGEAAVQTSQWPVAIRALEEAARGALKPEQGAVVWYWLGEAYFEQKQYAQAEMAYARVVSQFPENSLAGGAGYAAALAALRQGKNDGAQQYARGVVDRTPRAEERPRAQLLLAQLELDARRPRDARKGFEAVLADTSAAAREASVQDAALEGLVQALLDLNEHGVAAEHLQTLVGKLPATEPRRFRALLALGTCRFRQKQYEGALTAYRDAAQTPDGAVAGEALYWAANTLTALERHGEAAAEYDRLLKKHPNHAYAARAQLRQGDALVAAKQPAEASRAYRRVIEKYPEAEQAKEARQALVDLTGRTTDPVALAELLRALPPAERARGAARLARLHLEGRKFAEAERALNELLAELPAGEAPAESRYLLGVALEGQEKPEPAAAALAEAVRKEPAAVWAGDAHSRLAWLYLDLKRPADAEQAARAALSGQPMPATRLQARLALVQSLLGQERWEPTLTEARAFLETNPPQETQASLTYTVAWVLEKLARPAEALPQWERIVERHRKSEYAAEALVRIGDARFREQKYAEAREQYLASLTEAPQAATAREARFKLGTSLFHLTRFAEAAAEWDRLAVGKPVDEWVPEALYWAGAALEKADKKKDAILRLERLVAEFPKHTRVTNARIRLAALKAVTD